MVPKLAPAVSFDDRLGLKLPLSDPKEVKVANQINLIAQSFTTTMVQTRIPTLTTLEHEEMHKPTEEACADKIQDEDE